MGRNDFNRKQCLRALKKLGFERSVTRRGSHDKMNAPLYMAQQKQLNQPPFIMVPRSRKLHCQREILKEIHVLGGDELVEEFLKYI